MLKYTTLCINHLKNLTVPVLTNKTIDITYNQTRNTFILKRKYGLPLHKKNQKPRRLKARNFVYELIENTNSNKKIPIELILTSDVDRIGSKGQIVSLKPVKAYEQILLPQLGVYATPENIKKYASKENEKEDFISPSVKRTINILSTFSLSVTMSNSVPWTLEKWHVRASFRRTGFIVPEEAIIMPTKTISGPDMNIQGKEFYVIITINNKEQVKVRCKIHHFMADDQEMWHKPRESIFPEDKPILDSMPKPYCLQMSEQV